MKAQYDNGRIANLMPDDYTGESFIDIKSYALDIDMKDVETNQAWKFKIVEGELQYDYGKILEKENREIISKRVARYQQEVDPLVLEGIRLKDDALISKANELVKRIKKDLPKKEKI